MFPPPRRADPADATRALRNHLGALAAFCLAARAAPYVLQALATRRAGAA
jgi:hypothetical protein